MTSRKRTASNRKSVATPTKTVDDDEIKRRIDACWTELEGKLSASALASLHDGASDADLDAFESKFNAKLPKAFRYFYARHNGQDVEKIESALDAVFGESGLFTPLENCETANDYGNLYQTCGYDLHPDGGVESRRAQTERRLAEIAASGRKGGRGLGGLDSMVSHDDYGDEGHPIRTFVSFAAADNEEDSCGWMLALADGDNHIVLRWHYQESSGGMQYCYSRRESEPSATAFVEWLAQFVAEKGQEGEEEDDDDDGSESEKDSEKDDDEEGESESENEVKKQKPESSPSTDDDNSN
jgi:hypothetical protein